MFIPISIQNLTNLAPQRPIRPTRSRPGGHHTASANPSVIRREKPARPVSSKPILSERAWRYSSQLSIRCRRRIYFRKKSHKLRKFISIPIYSIAIYFFKSLISMPNGLQDTGKNSCSPREMAVDVEFHRAEEARWKRHSIAAAYEDRLKKNSSKRL